MKLGFIGVGEIATCLIKGLHGHEIVGSDKKEISIVKQLKSNIAVVDGSDIVFIAVKPQDIDTVLDEIKDAVSGKIIISVAAAIPIDRVVAKLGNVKLVRLLPNILVASNDMAGGYCTRNLSGEDEKLIEELFAPLGTVVHVEEKDIDIIALFSGSGPAFVAKLVQDYVRSGVNNGLTEDISRKLALQTFLGTVKLLQDMPPEELVKKVSSPGGITVEAIKELELEDIFDAMFLRGLKRTKELRDI